MGSIVSLCDDCCATQKDGIPCGMMFAKDVVEHCSRREKDANKHKALVDKYGPNAKKEEKKEVKEVK